MPVRSNSPKLEPIKENEMNRNLLRTIFDGVAMGVAVDVLSVVNPLSMTGATSLLGIGVAALSIAGLQKE
jgi:hypothetical protein